MLAPITAVLMTVIAFADGTPVDERHTEPMEPAACAEMAADMILDMADNPPPSEHPILAWSVTCQMERIDARGPQ